MAPAVVRPNWSGDIVGGIRVDSPSDLEALLSLHVTQWTPTEVAGWAAAPSEDGGGGVPELYWPLRDNLVGGQALLDLSHHAAAAYLGMADPALQDYFMESIDILREHTSKLNPHDKSARQRWIQEQAQEEDQVGRLAPKASQRTPSKPNSGTSTLMKQGLRKEPAAVRRSGSGRSKGGGSDGAPSVPAAERYAPEHIEASLLDHSRVTGDRDNSANLTLSAGADDSLLMEEIDEGLPCEELSQVTLPALPPAEGTAVFREGGGAHFLSTAHGKEDIDTRQPPGTPTLGLCSPPEDEAVTTPAPSLTPVAEELERQRAGDGWQSGGSQAMGGGDSLWARMILIGEQCSVEGGLGGTWPRAGRTSADASTQTAVAADVEGGQQSLAQGLEVSEGHEERREEEHESEGGDDVVEARGKTTKKTENFPQTGVQPLPHTEAATEAAAAPQKGVAAVEDSCRLASDSQHQGAGTLQLGEQTAKVRKPMDNSYVTSLKWASLQRRQRQRYRRMTALEVPPPSSSRFRECQTKAAAASIGMAAGGKSLGSRAMTCPIQATPPSASRSRGHAAPGLISLGPHLPSVLEPGGVREDPAHGRPNPKTNQCGDLEAQGLQRADWHTTERTGRPKSDTPSHAKTARTNNTSRPPTETRPGTHGANPFHRRDQQQKGGCRSATASKARAVPGTADVAHGKDLWTFETGHPIYRGPHRRWVMNVAWASPRPEWVPPDRERATKGFKTGADVRSKRVGNELHRLAGAGKLQEMKRFIRRPPAGTVLSGMVVGRNAAGQTPLHKAAAAAHLPDTTSGIFEALLATGADVNAKDGFQRTALHLVVQQWFGSNHSYTSAVERLLEAGADPNAADIDGETALHKAVLTYRSSKGFRTLSAILLRRGAGTEVRNSLHGYTPLHLACSRLLPSAVEILILAGADLDAQDAYGNSSLHLVVKYCLEQQRQGRVIVNMLLDWGADSSAKDSVGHTAADLTLLIPLPKLARLFPTEAFSPELVPPPPQRSYIPPVHLDNFPGLGHAAPPAAFDSAGAINPSVMPNLEEEPGTEFATRAYIRTSQLPVLATAPSGAPGQSPARLPPSPSCLGTGALQGRERGPPAEPQKGDEKPAPPRDLPSDELESQREGTVPAAYDKGSDPARPDNPAGQAVDTSAGLLYSSPRAGTAAVEGEEVETAGSTMESPKVKPDEAQDAVAAAAATGDQKEEPLPGEAGLLANEIKGVGSPPGDAAPGAGVVREVDGQSGMRAEAREEHEEGREGSLQGEEGVQPDGNGSSAVQHAGDIGGTLHGSDAPTSTGGSLVPPAADEERGGLLLQDGDGKSDGSFASAGEGGLQDHHSREELLASTPSGSLYGPGESLPSGDLVGLADDVPSSGSLPGELPGGSGGSEFSLEGSQKLDPESVREEAEQDMLAATIGNTALYDVELDVELPDDLPSDLTDGDSDEGGLLRRRPEEAGEEEAEGS
mmetsp:Transcript_17501/g.48826  ORF Transcript_17501/g.48826 Transcript_17501/m.48826 type:complete len:1462 (+) Transcript_17501:118-4503(+)